MTAEQILADLLRHGIDPELLPDGSLAFPIGALTDAQRQAIRANKPELVALLRQSQLAANDVLVDLFHIDAPWRQADRDYQRHHFGCAQCISAGQGRGTRCAVGLALWDAYNAALVQQGV